MPVMSPFLQIALLLACVAIILLCVQKIIHGRAMNGDFVSLRSEYFAEGQADIAQAIQHTIDVDAKLGMTPCETLQDIRVFVIGHYVSQVEEDTIHSIAKE